MQVLWMAKIGDVATAAKLARTGEDQRDRQAAVSDHANDPLPTIEARLQAATEEALGLLRGMAGDFIDRPWVRAPFEDETPRQSIDRLITSHIEDHARQITEARNSVGG